MQPPPMLNDAERSARLRAALGEGAGAVWRGRRLIAALTALAAAAAVAVSLLLPNWYASSARVLLPEAGSSALGTLLGGLPPQASRLLGAGSASDYSRYLAILTSDSMADRVIDEFGLVAVYQKTEDPYPRTATRRALRRNVTFEVDRQYGTLSITVLDRERERAAAMANFLVQELNRRNGELSAQTAAQYRRYVERRHREVVARLDSAQLALQRVQEELGVVELPATAEAFMRGVAELRANALQLEMQHAALLRQYGPENPRVQAARDALNTARAAERAALGGRDPLLPIGQQALPAAASRYASAYREVLLQSELLKVTQPLYEQARFDEERERVAVQVVDMAQPAERKAAPRRALIVVSVTLSALVLSVLLVLALHALRRPAHARRGAVLGG